MVLNEDNLAVEEYEQPYSKKFRLATNFCGCLSLRNGMWVIGLTDLAFGLLMAFSYFREPELALRIAGGIRVFCGLWCFGGLISGSQTMTTLYLLMLLFNNCLVLAVCIGFVIILTSPATMVCTLAPKPLRLGEPPVVCPLFYRKGFWEASLTTAEFIVYLYYIYIAISHLRRKELQRIDSGEEIMPIVLSPEVVVLEDGILQDIEAI